MAARRATGRLAGRRRCNSIHIGIAAGAMQDSFVLPTTPCAGSMRTAAAKADAGEAEGDAIRCLGPRPCLALLQGAEGALDAMVRAVALQIGWDGMGVIDAPVASVLLSETIAALGAHSAPGRIGQPDDIAGAATWLSSPEAAFVTGQSILVDGGHNIGGMR